MKRRNRIFYVGMITTDAYGRAVGESTYAGAASRKMILVARALRNVGCRAIVVSLPFVGTEAKRAVYGSVLTSGGGSPTVFLATLRSRYLRKMIGPFFMAAFFLRQSVQGDTVIVYNHAVEYIPALFVLAMRGVKIVQDIEDAPTVDQKGVRGFMDRMSFAITFRLTDTKKMVVADHVAKGLNLKDYVVIRGVASQETKALDYLNGRKWEALRAGGDLKLHFGGTLIQDTGVDLFCETVELLAQNDDRLERHLDLKVTGVGDLDKIRNLRHRIQSSRKVRLELLPELSKPDYLALIHSCHSSLSLKRPGSGVSNTTFPSKVIEITASGLALVSTPVGDVTSLFTHESIFFLTEYDPAVLADIIEVMARDPEKVERVAKAGYGVCNRMFSEKAVGEEMVRLL